MLSSLLAVALIAACGWYVLGARTAATGFLAELNIQTPLLARFEPVRSASRPAMSERVVLVIIDGLGYRNARSLAFLEALGSRGVHARASAMSPTISRPNYVAIATGVPPRHSGVRTNDYRWPVQLDSITATVRAAGGATVFASDRSTGFPIMFAEHLSHGMHAPWRGGLEKAMRQAVKLPSKLVVLLPQAVDVAGHQHGAASDEYAAAATGVTQKLASALAAIDLTRETIIITADHGHTERGGHGGIEDEVVHVPLIMAGAGIRRGAVLRDARLIDLAPTIARLLGVSVPGHGLGRTLTEALELSADARARIERQDAHRRERNLALVATETANAIDARAELRARRLPIALALLIAGALLVMGLARLRVLHIDWRVLACALPVFPLTFYGLVYSLGRLSLSSLVEPEFVLHRLFALSAIAIVVHIGTTWIALRGRVQLRHRLAAANAITLCGLLVASVPPLLVWSLCCGSPVLLPHPKLLLLIPVMYGAIVAYGVAAAVTLGLELTIFLARASDPRLAHTRAEATGLPVSSGLIDISSATTTPPVVVAESYPRAA